MKPQDIFCLVVRLSGYFIALFAAVTIFNMVIGDMPFRFKGLFQTAIIGALGGALIKIAPLIGAFAYPNDPAE